MDNPTLFLIMSVSAWLLGFIIGLLVLYLVIRLAVTHGMKSYQRWLDAGKR